MSWPVHFFPQPHASLRQRLRGWLRAGRPTATKYLSWRAVWIALALPVALGLLTYLIIQSFNNVWLIALTVMLLVSVAVAALHRL